MAVPVYLLSVLQRKALVQGSTFLRDHSEAWLVWERGTRRSARARPTSDDEVARRHATAPPSPPEGEDPLCLQLRLEEDQPALVVGCAGGNHLLVNDPAGCSVHCSLQERGGRWYLVAFQGEVTLGGHTPGLAGAPPLESGEVLALGPLRLTYHDALGLHARLLAPGATPLPTRPPNPRPEPA